MKTEKTLLEVKDLRTYYHTDFGIVKAVDGVSFSLQRGEKVAIIGESGAGKSQTGMTILNLIESPPGKIESGQVLYEGIDLLKLNEDELRGYRGVRIGVIFQEAADALNPVYTVGSQIADAYRAHNVCSKQEAWARAVDILDKVQIGNAPKRAGEYPHQFSGGMRQRAVIALAMVNSPDLLIADEPTTALDVTTEAKIIRLIDDLVTKEHKSLIFITHDLAVAAGVCHRFIIMYAGRIVEEASVEKLFSKPRHPYTHLLLSALIDLTKSEEEILVVPGTPPDAYNRPIGCPFWPRCPLAQERCRQENPPTEIIGPDQKVACFYHQEYRSLPKVVTI
ncbi:MAG: ABC transporter ATP-binding protein [Limnochordia bacterium]